VLELLAEGRTNKEIARELHVTIETVKHHVSGIMRKLRVKTRTGAAAIAWRARLAEQERPMLCGRQCEMAKFAVFRNGPTA
jgi:FixJ family two-component response regulator